MEVFRLGKKVLSSALAPPPSKPSLKPSLHYSRLRWGLHVYKRDLSPCLVKANLPLEVSQLGGGSGHRQVAQTTKLGGPVHRLHPPPPNPFLLGNCEGEIKKKILKKNLKNITYKDGYLLPTQSLNGAIEAQFVSHI